MKKLVIASILGLIVSAPAAFGQGYVAFAGSLRSVWDTTGGVTGFDPPLTDSELDVAFLWAPSTVTSDLVDAIMATTPTNGWEGDNYGAWQDISSSLTSAGGQWTVGASNGTIAVQQTAANGSFVYNNNQGFPVDGMAAFTEYSMFIIGWSTVGGSTNLASAMANDAQVGWSSVFQFTTVNSFGFPSVMVFNKFGVGQPFIPEPATLTLAGLGGLSMLFLRRKKA